MEEALPGASVSFTVPGTGAISLPARSDLSRTARRAPEVRRFLSNTESEAEFSHIFGKIGPPIISLSACLLCPDTRLIIDTVCIYSTLSD